MHGAWGAGDRSNSSVWRNQRGSIRKGAKLGMKEKKRFLQGDVRECSRHEEQQVQRFGSRREGPSGASQKGAGCPTDCRAQQNLPATCPRPPPFPPPPHPPIPHWPPPQPEVTASSLKLIPDKLWIIITLVLMLKWVCLLVGLMPSIVDFSRKQNN